MLQCYNIWGKVIESGKIHFDFENETVTTQSNKTFKIINDHEFTYKFQKTQIRACGGINGLYEFVNDINSKDSPFNPCRTSLFINL